MEKKLLLKIKSKSVYTQVRSNSSTQTQIIQENPTIGQTGYMYTLPNQAIGKPVKLDLVPTYPERFHSLIKQQKYQ